MTDRRKAFELECALGQSMKLLDQSKDLIQKHVEQNGKLCDMVTVLTIGIQNYLDTMDKKYLIGAIDSTRERAKYFRGNEQTTP